MYDYGPIHNFWLFCFKRYDGILEHFPPCNHSLEIQLMQRLIHDFAIKSLTDPVLRGSLHATLHSQFVVPTDPVQVKDWSLSACSMDITLAKSYVRCSLSDSVLSDLLIAYSLLYPPIPVEDIEVNSAFDNTYLFLSRE